MNATLREHIERIPMSWEEYDALPEDFRDEYVDGALISKPTPRVRHAEVCTNMVQLLRVQLPKGFLVLPIVGWFVDGNEFIPDVVVADEPGDVRRLTKIPHLVVEVLSSDTFFDTVIKHQKYAQAGVPKYWIVDPKGPTLWVHELQTGDYQKRAVHPPGKRATLDVGPVQIKLDPGKLVG